MKKLMKKNWIMIKKIWISSSGKKYVKKSASFYKKITNKKKNNHKNYAFWLKKK